MKRMTLLLTALMMLLPFWAKDDYRYRHITMNDGLSANAVRNIVQDDQGFIWFGTDNGLCRYDGVKVQPYRINELGYNQYISSLLVDDGQLFIGTAQGVFLLKYKDQTITRLPINISSTVTSIAHDKEDGLWISTYGQGVWQYIPNTGKTKHYDIKETSGAVAQVYVDNNNQVWTVTNWGAPVIQRLNRLHNEFEAVNLSSPLLPSLNYNALRMLQTRDGRMWLGTWENGLMLLHSNGQLEQVLSPDLSKAGSHIHTLYELSDDCICIGCDDGAICFNPHTREWHHLLGKQSLKARFVYAITSDKEGGLWMGTFYGGVSYISPVGKRFEAFTVENGLSGNVISRFCEDNHGRIWVASDDGGLMCYLPKEQRFSNYPHQALLSRLNAHALCMAGNELWIGTYTDGVKVLNTDNGSLRDYSETSSPLSLDNSSSYAIYQDRSGNIWVATMVGLNRYNRAQNNFERISQIDDLIIDIDEDSEGNLWLSTQGSGLWKYMVSTKKFITYRNDEKDPMSISDNQVNCALVDESGRLWIGTAAGLCLYDKERNRFKRISLDVPSRSVMSIIEDHGALWLSTERGIVKYDPKQLQRFTLHDGLVSEQFQINSGLKSSDGRIYFGSTSGFNAFYPYQIKANNVMPPVFITSLGIMNHEERTASGLPIDLSQMSELTLDYSDARMFTLSFAALSYCSPGKNQYAYRLEGFDNDWNYVGNQNRATYTNIPSGTYIFHVKATNNDGIWSDNEATLKIVVHPPFWWSWYAKIVYLLLIVATMWLYVRYRVSLVENRHQREMREARLQFFTMIAHEIRTPVSLIIGPLEKLMKKGTPSDDLKVIDRNAHRLLELVNQLLDFRKVEQQRVVMHFAPQNIYELLQNVSERFAPTFEQGGKQFSIDYPDEHFTAIIDKEAVTKVVSNLLTNANKYCKDQVGLSCIIEPDGEHFSIIVSDNGIGIREEDRRRIFEPFFQAQDNKPGTGIGLNIVKNIVDMHHGEITVESEVGHGSTFKVLLPVVQDTSNETYPVSMASSSPNVQPTPVVSHDQKQTANIQHAKDDRPTMLIVDDSEDMVNFLRSNFSEKYHVITAGDGVEALDKLSKNEISIIISDWMMPRMDGAEFCRQLRCNPLTSHIPFVMLTAKTDDDSKVESMDVGADTYIEKPFSVQYLEACIRNILDMRRRLIEKFSTQPLEPVTEIASNPTDNEFLKQMQKLIEENFSNSELNVNFLAEQLNISRSGLFAKIKTLADATPNEMIQIIRLKRAAELLKENKYSISEIAYMVGFSSPSYFSKCFLKQFGIRPADYMKQV
jgi:signal transduction histidine kinase/ligand-binding sensor domain-containing protein/DNA-binding response OmpR family regulator